MPTLTNGLQITGGVTITGNSSSLTDVTPDIVANDWTAENSSTITEPTTGTFRFDRTHVSNRGTGYYTFTNLTGGQSYRLDFEFRRVHETDDFKVMLQRNLGSDEIDQATMTTGTTFSSESFTWTQDSGDTTVFLRTQSGNQNLDGEVRGITLYET